MSRLEDLVQESREEAEELVVELKALQRALDKAGISDERLPLLVSLRQARAMEALASAYGDLADAQMAAMDAAMGRAAADDDDDDD